VPAATLQDTVVVIQNQLDYAGLVVLLMHCSGEVRTQEWATIHGKATTHGVGATVKLQEIFKIVMQKANIGPQEDQMPQCAVQDHAVYVVQQDTIEGVCVLKVVNLVTSNVQTAV